MPKYFLTSFLFLLVFFSLSAPLPSHAQFLETGPTCTPEVIPDFGDIPTPSTVTCPWCPAKLGSTKLRLNWDLDSKEFKTPFCVVGCSSGNGCDGAFRKDDQNIGTTSVAGITDPLARFNLKPKDEIYMTNVRPGNQYGITCCETCTAEMRANDDCTSLPYPCQKGSTITSVPVQVKDDCRVPCEVPFETILGNLRGNVIPTVITEDDFRGWAEGGFDDFCDYDHITGNCGDYGGSGQGKDIQKAMINAQCNYANDILTSLVTISDVLDKIFLLIEDEETRRIWPNLSEDEKFSEFTRLVNELPIEEREDIIEKIPGVISTTFDDVGDGRDPNNVDLTMLGKIKRYTTEYHRPIKIGYTVYEYNKEDNSMVFVGQHSLIALKVEENRVNNVLVSVDLKVLNPTGPRVETESCKRESYFIYDSQDKKLSHSSRFVCRLWPTSPDIHILTMTSNGMSFSESLIGKFFNYCRDRSESSFCKSRSTNMSYWLENNYPDIGNMTSIPEGEDGYCYGWTDFVLSVAYLGDFVGTDYHPDDGKYVGVDCDANHYPLNKSNKSTPFNNLLQRLKRSSVDSDFWLANLLQPLKNLKLK